MRLRGRWRVKTIAERLRVVTPEAFAIGYASHRLDDTYRFLLAGDLWAARFLVDPLFTVSKSPSNDIAPWVRLFNIYQEMGSHPQVNLVILAAVVFVALRVRQSLRQSKAE